MTKIAIIGGSGLENPEILKNPVITSLKTPYGDPSSDFICGTIGQIEVVLLSRPWARPYNTTITG